MSALQAGSCCRVGIGNYAPSFRDNVRQPFGIGIGSGLVSLDGFRLPVVLALHATVRVLTAQTLDIASQEFDPFHSQPFKRGHDGTGPGITRVDKMGDVPVIRMLAAFLGQIHAGPLGAQGYRLIGDIVAGLGDAVGTVAPVYGAYGLAVAVDASVFQVNFAAGFFLGRAHPKYFRRGDVARCVRRVDHCQGDGRQQGQDTDQYNSWGHSHVDAPRLKYRDRTTLYKPI